MDTKIKTLSDDELKDVTGGWLILGKPNVPCSSYGTQSSCVEYNCKWDSSTKKCS